MKIIRADHLGMCFGVRDAIALANQRSQSEPVTILGELVHNQVVLDQLAAAGVRIETDVNRIQTRTAMITAHGTSEKALQAALARGLDLYEATCPLVHHAHAAVKLLIREGYHPVIVGKRDHVEVRGITDDLHEFDVILSEEDIEALTFRPRFGVAAQTTQPITRVRHLVDRLRARFPESEIRFIDTVCHPTKQRQKAAEDLARKADVVLVIGGSNSNNTKELVQTCSQYCPHVYHLQTPAQVQPEWLNGFETVGITAGTSTPDSLIDALEKRIHELGASCTA